MKSVDKIICLMGPTASGKTDLAIRLCERLPCEIISVDSVLVYRGMDVGTAKPSKDVLSRFPHHLIDIREPTDPYSAADFLQEATTLVDTILSRGKIPLFVGGTMLYFRALQDGLSQLPKSDPATRKQLNEEMAHHGLLHLHRRLERIDAKSAARISQNDPQRILRALEVYELTGKPLSELWQETDKACLDKPVINIALAPAQRSVLHSRIAQRFHAMLAKGFIEEVETLLKIPEMDLTLPALRAVGYRQIADFLAGHLHYEAMVEQSIIATRQLAKRQLTWLRAWHAVHWVDSEQSDPLSDVLGHI